MATDWPKEVKRLRKAAKLTQQQLADAAGVDRSLVGQFETRRSGVSLETLEKMVEACGGQLVAPRLEGADPEVVEQFVRFLQLATPGQRKTVAKMIGALVDKAPADEEPDEAE